MKGRKRNIGEKLVLELIRIPECLTELREIFTFRVKDRQNDDFILNKLEEVISKYKKYNSETLRDVAKEILRVMDLEIYYAEWDIRNNLTYVLSDIESMFKGK